MECLYETHLTFAGKTKTKTSQFILIIIIISPVSTVAQGLATCNTSSVEPLSKALITCQFLQNSTEETQNITVYRYVEQNQTKVLLECYSRNNRPYCDKEDGVRYTGNFIQNVTVEIPSKTLEESRLYLCSTGYSKADSVTCTFGGSRSADTENPTDDTALCSSNWCKNKDILDANEPSTDGSKLIFALAIPAYVIASLIVLYVCIRRLHPTGIILLKVFCHKNFREKSSLVGSRTTLPTRVDYVSIHSVEIK